MDIQKQKNKGMWVIFAFVVSSDKSILQDLQDLCIKDGDGMHFGMSSDSIQLTQIVVTYDI